MTHERKATPTEKLRGYVYKCPWLIILLLTGGLSFMVYRYEMMDQIIINATTLAVTGAAIAAFLFTVQSILVSVPKENPFMQFVRKDGRYLVYIHCFCRVAEIGFLLLMIPMLYMEKERVIFNIVVFALFASCLSLTIWSMYLVGKILIICERQAK